MTNDFDLGTGSINVSSTRFIYHIEWKRDKDTKNETMTGFVEQTNRNVDTNKVISRDYYLVPLTDADINSCAGHNTFLRDIKTLINTSIGSGSFRQL